LILRSVIRHVRDQNWFAVGLDFLIVVVGVFIGIQVSNWNDQRAAGQQRDLIVEALINDIRDHIAVQNRFVDRIDADFKAWEQARAAGQRPDPVVFRIEGSDSAPDTWGTLRQMPVATLLDPASAVMLSYYYSELDGLSAKFIRYVGFVEDRILPYLDSNAEFFYTDEGDLKRPYRASMDRLREHRAELVRMTAWAECIVGQLDADGLLGSNCSRSEFGLDDPIARSSIQ